jgi:hypothetical protein
VLAPKSVAWIAAHDLHLKLAQRPHGAWPQFVSREQESEEKEIKPCLNLQRLAGTFYQMHQPEWSS